MATVDEPPDGYFDLDPGGYDGPPIDEGGRPLPHDLQAEESLIGAWLLSETARIATVGMVGPEDFYKPAHGHIIDAIDYLVADGSPIDVAIVANRMRAVGTLSMIGGPAVLASMQAATPATSNAHRYAKIVADMAHQRRMIYAASAVLDAARAGDVNGAMTLASEMASRPSTEQSSWLPIDLGPVLDGSLEPTLPDLLERADGEHMLYLGKIHAFNAEPESAKSWLALHACVQTMAGGMSALYIDFEDDQFDIVARLVTLGCPVQTIRDLFLYVKPQEPMNAQHRAQIVGVANEVELGLCIIDGVTEALHQNGWSINDNDEVAAFFEAIPRPIAATMAAVVLIDHVTKNADDRGRFAIGAQHKLAGITGASYTLEMVDPFAEGRVGRSRITVQKDKPGMVRKYAQGGKVVGMFTLASMSDGSGATASIEPPAGDPTSPDRFRPTHIMGMISDALATVNGTGVDPTASAVAKLVHARREHVLAALMVMVDEGYVEITGTGPRGATMHHLTRPYVERFDPLSDRFEPLPADYTDPDALHDVTTEGH